jgi:MoxR-like ATPase
MDPQKFRETFAAVETEVKKVIVGQTEVIRRVLIAFFAGGHVLLEGVPGLGKTLLVKSVSRALGLSFKRIQFTPDLMPSDITGTQLLAGGDGRVDFEFRKGPIFAQVVLADEINRATPKTQSAVLEAMEERQVTVFGDSHRLETPFMVLATQNPIELEGTYPLPEAQLDRFLFKIVVAPPGVEEMREIVRRTTGEHAIEAARVVATDGPATIFAMQKLLRQVIVAPPLENYVARLIHAAQPTNKDPALSQVKSYLRFGVSPRGAQAVILGAKGRAAAEGRAHVSHEDIDAVVDAALRHRLLLNFQAEAENVSADDLLSLLRQKVPRF